MCCLSLRWVSIINMMKPWFISRYLMFNSIINLYIVCEKEKQHCYWCVIRFWECLCSFFIAWWMVFNFATSLFRYLFNDLFCKYWIRSFIRLRLEGAFILKKFVILLLCNITLMLRFGMLRLHFILISVFSYFTAGIIRWYINWSIILKK